MLAAASLYGVVPQIDVTAIMARSVEANSMDWQAAPSYSYFETDRTAGATQTYRVSMILGSPYYERVKSNGQPLPLDEQADEQRKLNQAIDQRRAESPAQRAKRVATYEMGRRRDHMLIGQLVQAFHFTLVGQQMLGERRVWVLRATPERGYKPPNRDTKVLTGMQGKLWIDAQTYQWVKVEAEVIHPVWIAGFLAKVERGTQFDLEYAPVADSIWEPTHFLMRSRAQVLFLFTHQSQANESYFGYRKAGED